MDLDAEKKATEELNRRWLAAIRAKDADAIAGFFAEDGIAIYDGETFETPDAIRRDSEESFSRPNATGTFESELIVVSEGGDMAYDIGRFSGGFDGPEGRVESKGRYTTVWRKIGPEWKVVVDMASSEPEAGQNPE